MSSVSNFIDEHLTDHLDNLLIQDQGKKMKGVIESEKGCEGLKIGDHHGETALVKGCEHGYCVTCILRWASYSEHPKCPQCKHPFEFLNVHRSLDGSIHDYMFEESVCLLLRAAWFKPLVVEHQLDMYDELEEFYAYEYEDEEDDMDEAYFSNSTSLRIGNRRWGVGGQWVH
ncbi:hypothetical protein Ancab_000188 [Ancistrocladus abbreviatus]